MTRAAGAYRAIVTSLPLRAIRNCLQGHTEAPEMDETRASAGARFCLGRHLHSSRSRGSRPALLLVVRREGSEERLEMLGG